LEPRDVLGRWIGALSPRVAGCRLTCLNRSQRETVEWYLDIDSDYWEDIEAVLHAHAPASIQRLKMLSSANK